MTGMAVLVVCFSAALLVSLVFFLQGRGFWVQDPIVSLAQTHFTLIFSFFLRSFSLHLNKRSLLVMEIS